MENKTAVEQCIDQFKDWLNHELGHDFTSMMILEQIENGALYKYIEMEKQQIIDAKDCWFKDERDGDEYYLETFKNTTE